MTDKRIKIVHILEGFEGGMCTFIYNVLPRLVKEGFDVTLIGSLTRSNPDTDIIISKLKANGVIVHIIPMYREIKPLRDIHSFTIITRLLAKNRYDIIHTHCSKAGALGRTAGILVGKNKRLHTPHCFAFIRCNSQLQKRLYFVIEKLLGKLTTKLVTVSRSEAAIAVSQRIVHGRKCVRVKNGLPNEQQYFDRSASIQKSQYKNSLGLKSNTQIVSTICRLVEYKGIFRFLKAAALSRTPNVAFLIAGEGKLRTPTERFIKENNLSNKVKLLGHLTNTEELYSISDIFTLCSDAEAQPYVLLEAMRAKCPIVATSVHGNKELISNNKTGILVEPEPVSISRAIDELLANRNKRKEYAENAYAYFRKHHTLDKQISELTKIYKSFI